MVSTIILLKNVSNVASNIVETFYYLSGENSHEEECIPVGCVPSAAVAVCWGVSLPQCMVGYTPQPDPSTSPLGMGLEIPLARPPNLPLGIGLETLPHQTPQLPLWVCAWRPPQTDPSTSPLGTALETPPPRTE